MERGFDPEVVRYFKKIMSSFFLGLLWMLTNVTAGLYFGLAYLQHGKWNLANLLYYFFAVISLSALIWYYYRTWKK
jgi:hypothetical protein